MKRQKSKKNVVRKVWVGLVLVAVLVGGGVWWVIWGEDLVIGRGGGVGEAKNEEALIAIEPEIDKENNHSDKIEELKIDDADGRVVAEVILTSYGETGASGMVEGTTDTSGECVYVFIRDDEETIETRTETLPSAGSVVCAAVNFGMGELKNGEWSVQLLYDSEYTKGVSDVAKFKI
jgi:hypothetical protein